MKVAVAGLGSMGFGMAGSLIRAGHQVQGIDVNPDAVARLAGAQQHDPGDLDALMVVVLNAAQAEAVMFGPSGLVPRMRPGAVVLCCVTVAPDFARAMEARCADLGVLYLDAPISGGSVKAAQGKLSIMASGRPEAFAAAEPLLQATAETVFRLGDSAGPGSAMKAVNQMLA
ncbi:MAG: NAD(P)-dependent oxidoreductase, partial [Anaerolineae bacterium]|nr:NAD(P)-dependent oxidoreductase [Anaerolineae bacterium]